MGFNATWSMAVGGMVGGGIFSVLGVVIEVAGRWAWASFLIGGLIAACAASSYALLAEKFGEGGGAFAFLRDVHHREMAGSVSWIVIVGYVLTMSVYAFTFGHYLSNVLGLGHWVPPAAAVVLITVLVGVNLRGIGSAATAEIVTVWGKLFVLCGLGIWGIATWMPERVLAAEPTSGTASIFIGAASVFMAYEGFQLLSYDYDEIEDAAKTVPRAMLTAIASVIVIYLLVTFGATMLVGAETIIEKKEIALAEAGRQLGGTPGMWVVTVAALFSTASAINATLFAVGRLVRNVAADGELPRTLAHTNDQKIPDRAIVGLGALAAVLAVVGSLDLLVEAASLGFLLTFAVVSALAAYEVKRRRVVSIIGFVGATGALLVLLVEQAMKRPVSLGVFIAVVLIATVGRHFLLRWFVEEE